jgi:1-acyl-sn-glycerol-3-phosphate acyltransferase
VRPSKRADGLRPGRWPQILRLAAGYLSFGGFALGIVLATPFVALVSRDRDQRERRVQRLIHHAWRGYLRCLGLLGVSRVRLPKQADALRRGGVLVVANHPGRLDFGLLLAVMPQADLIVKRSYHDHPLLGLASRAAGYQPADGGAALVEACAERLVRGRSLIVFPEGTRSPAGGLGAFQRGAARIALAAGRDPIPAYVTCDPPSLHRDQRWWESEQDFELRLELGEALPIKELAGEAKTGGQAARAVTAALYDHFHERVSCAQA